MDHLVREDLRAYAAFREGQDRISVSDLAVAMLRRRLQDQQKRLKKEPLWAYAAYRKGQDDARPEGNYGLFYHRRKLYGPQ